MRPRIVLQTTPPSSSVQLFPIASNEISAPFSSVRAVATLVFILQTSSSSGVEHGNSYYRPALYMDCCLLFHRVVGNSCFLCLVLYPLH